MHELVLAESALQIALGEARKRDADRVLGIVLRVGDQSGVDPDALRFALESILLDTIAEGATVQLETVASSARCESCGHEFAPVDGLAVACPACGHAEVTPKSSRELNLVRLELSFRHADELCS